MRVPADNADTSFHTPVGGGIPDTPSYRISCHALQSGVTTPRRTTRAASPYNRKRAARRQPSACRKDFFDTLNKFLKL